MPLLCEKTGHVATLTLSRPEARNAWCAEFMAGFRELLPKLEEDREVRCVILTGDEKGGRSAPAQTSRIHALTPKIQSPIFWTISQSGGG